MGDDLLELEPCGPALRPPPDGRRRSPRTIAAVMAAVALAVGVASVLQGDAPATPQERLAAVVAFAKRADSVEFTIDYQVRRGGPDGHILARTRSEGVVGPEGKARWRESDTLDGAATEETIVLPEVVYRRTAAQPDLIAAAKWIPAAVEEGVNLHGSSSAWALPDSVLSTPPFVWMRDRRFSRLVGAGGPVRAASDGTLTASRALADIYSEVPESMAGRAWVELTAGRDGRLGRLILTVDSPRDTITAAGQTRVPYQTVTDIRFRRWGRTGTIAAPPLGEVDQTPEIDEGRIAAVSWSVVAPTVLPDGFRLRAAAFRDGRCQGVSLDYSGRQDRYESSYLHIDEQPAECASRDAWDRHPLQEKPFPAGPYLGSIRRDGEASAASVRLEAGGTVVTARSNLADAALQAVLASLGPLDFSTQPVERPVPGS